MKKLLITTDLYLPKWDGVSRFLNEIVPRLKKNFDITIIAPDFGDYKEKNARLIRMPVIKRLKFVNYPIPRIKKKIIAKEIKKADIVFNQTIGPIGYYTIKRCKRTKKPIVSFIHSLEWELFPKALSNNLLKKIAYPIVKRMIRKLYNGVSCLFVPSYHIAESLMWQGIYSRMEIVHLGTDIKKFFPANNRKKIKKELNLNPDSVIIGYHGRISEEKDLVTLLRAYMRLRSKYKDKEINLLIVGDGLEKLKNKLKSKQGVFLAGKQDFVLPYLQAMDIYVLPSLTETTSLSTLEAMSCELPVIVTEVGFIKDYIKQGKNGLFFEKQNPFHLAKQIELLINNLSLRKELGKKARETVKEKFNWDNTSSEIERLLASMVQ